MLTFEQFDRVFTQRFKGRMPIAPTVLPAVYDDVLSYEEWLSKIRYKINELGAYIEEQLADVEQLVHDQVTAELKAITDKYDKEIADLNHLIETVDEYAHSLDGKIDDKVTMLTNYINDEILRLTDHFNAELYDFFLQNKKYTDDKVNAERIYRKADINLINERLDNYIREFPLVYCPPLGRYTDIESALVEVWDSLRMFALTASEYDNFDFTCTEYSDLLLSAFEYDVYGGYILRENIKQMFNPFTGKHENIRNVVNDICDYLKFNGKTAGEYDAYEFTASEFDNSDYTAFPQDTSKYWTTPVMDLKNKYLKNYVRMFEDSTSQSQASDSVDETFTGNTKGFVVYIQKDSTSAVEEVELSGVGTFKVEDDNGYWRVITISVSNDTYTVEWTDCYTDPADPTATDNTKNIIRAIYRVGGAYDVTELNA